ncbi:LuxR C-terminal-related transcriptional regulator [Haliscomenobacter sp.]|uniref:LuxR C-terminal-related transcriptional regulator n=1 Tax=Haliscomenobacter sp. TaxID=2717303 RepID=UPI003BAB7D67
METNNMPDVPQRWWDYWQSRAELAKDEELAGVLKRYFNPDIIFCTGQYFFAVIEGTPTLKIKHLQGNLEQMTGQAKEQFIGKSLMEIHRVLIPSEDSPILLSFSQFCINFLSTIPSERHNQVKFSFYFNILHKTGKLVPVIQQDSIYTNAEGIPEYCFSFITDVSHLKARNDLVFTILIIDEQGNQQFKCFSPKQLGLQLEVNGSLTVRERQIISGLAEGLTSKQIAVNLGISFHTVNTHRQNMLAKTGCKSSAELIKYALEHMLI